MTYDFSTFEKRCELALQGIFSIDQPENRAARAEWRDWQIGVDADYELLGVSRKRTHASIAARLEATATPGIWARSTGAYSAACRAADEEAQAKATALREAIQRAEAPAYEEE